MQHIPVVSHALWRGTFILKMLDMVPTIQTPGSYHRQDSCLFTVGKSLTGLGSRGREVRGEEVEVSHWCQWKREISKGLWVASPHQQGQLRLALLTSTTVSAFERVSGVGRSTVVPLYIQWVEPRMFTTPWSIQWCHLSLLTSHLTTSTLPNPPCKLPFFFLHAVVRVQESDRRIDGNVKTSYLIQTLSLCYRIVISQRKDMILCHIKTFLQHLRMVKENTPSRP